MEEILSFDPEVTEPSLPENFMPAALAALRADGLAEDRMVLPLRSWIEGVKFDVARPEDIADFTYWAKLGLLYDLPEFPFCLGPPIAAPKQRDGRFLTFQAAEIAPIDNDKTAVVIIDHGIAFWNQRFRDLGTGACRFRAIQHLNFDKTDPTTFSIATLAQPAIGAMCDLADKPGGNGEVIAALAKQFPSSFFAQRPDPDDLWHGSAMADIAAGAGPDNPDHAILFGLELPAAALRDWGGDTLQAILPAALSAALAMASLAKANRIVIVLAFGYPAGPHDVWQPTVAQPRASHPISRAVEDFMQNSRDNGHNVKLVLPAGNHLQDHCCAQLPAATAAMTTPEIIWRLAPDDFSPSTVEICLRTASTPRLRLTAPSGKTVYANLPTATFTGLRLGGNLIAGLHRLPDRGGWIKLRLSIQPTAWTITGRTPAPFGDWRIGIEAPVPADLWILRDDRDRVQDRAKPHRPSVFFDPAYQIYDPVGAFVLDDKLAGPQRRAGTASVLTTAQDANLICVQADERTGSGKIQQAEYSGAPYATSRSMDTSVLVEDQFKVLQIEAIGNGGPRRFYVSGTSAATAAQAKVLR